MHNPALGLIILIVAGAMNGSFTLPMKFTKNWAWENTWLAWTLFALFFLPPVVTFISLPNVREVYSQTGMGPVWIVAACGAGWGISQVFFGLAVEAVGIALAFSVILGLAADRWPDPVVTLFSGHSAEAFSAGGLGILGGVALVIIGVGICAVAGRRREKALGLGPQAGKASIGMGLLYCLFSGLGSALVGIGLESGKALVDASVALHGNPLWAPMVAWLPLMLAGGIPNLLYCLYLLRKNKTGGKFSLPATGGYWLLAFVMAICWFGSTLMYGMS